MPRLFSTCELIRAERSHLERVVVVYAFPEFERLAFGLLIQFEASDERTQPGSAQVTSRIRVVESQRCFRIQTFSVGVESNTMVVATGK